MSNKPTLISVADRNGDILIDAASAYRSVRRYDSHRVAARKATLWATEAVSAPLPMATKNAPQERGPMATPDLPPSRYEVEDFDDLAPMRGIVVAAIVAAFGMFVAALYWVR